MPTATVHIPKVEGFFGVARCFRLDPPRVIDGIEREFVTIAVQPRVGMQSPEVRVYPATERGTCATPQLLRRVGSFTPDEPLDLEGCYWYALLGLGGYVQAEPAETGDGPVVVDKGAAQ